MDILKAQIEYRTSFPSVGENTAKKLIDMGIHDREELFTLGTEEVFERYIEKK